MALPPTPWLNTPDYSGNYLRGLQIGAEARRTQDQAAAEVVSQIARANSAAQIAASQLDEARYEAELRSRTEHDLANQRFRETQSRIDIDSAYNNAQIKLAQGQLSEVMKMNKLKADQFADQAAAVQEYTKRVSEGKEDPAKVALELAPRMGATGNQIVSSASSLRAELPDSLKGRPVIGPDGSAVPGLIAVPTTSGTLTARAIPGYERPGSVGEANMMWARNYQEQLKPLKEEWTRYRFDPNVSEKDPKRESRRKQLLLEMNDLENKVRSLVPEPGMDSERQIGGFKIRRISR